MAFIKQNIFALAIDAVNADFFVRDQALNFSPDAVPTDIVAFRHILAELNSHFACSRYVVILPNGFKLILNPRSIHSYEICNLFVKVFLNFPLYFVLLTYKPDNMDQHCIRLIALSSAISKCSRQKKVFYCKFKLLGKFTNLISRFCALAKIGCSIHDFSIKRHRGDILVIT